MDNQDNSDSIFENSQTALQGDLFEIQRQMQCLILIGKVVNTDYAKNVAYVKINDISNTQEELVIDLPWLFRRATGDIEWWAPEKDEQVVVLAPGGDLVQGIIIGSLPYVNNEQQINFSVPTAMQGYNAGTDQPDYKSFYYLGFQDGTSIAYNKKEQHFTIRLSGEAPASADTPAIPQVVCDILSRKDQVKLDLKIGDATTQPKIQITLDATQEGDLTVITKGKATVTADGDVNVTTKGAAAIKADGDITAQAKGNVNINADGNVSVNTQGNLEIKTTGNLNLEASGQVVIKGATIDLKGASVNASN